MIERLGDLLAARPFVLANPSRNVALVLFLFDVAPDLLRSSAVGSAQYRLRFCNELLQQLKRDPRYVRRGNIEWRLLGPTVERISVRMDAECNELLALGEDLYLGLSFFI